MSTIELASSARPVLLALLLSLAATNSGVAQTGTPPPATPASARHTSVHFEGGLLTVTASNASLNGVLREISRTTGMKISGTVAEDRVFGTYGPEDPQRVLATLLDGTGTNILILSNQADKPLELVLTRRTGGATPPNPNEAANSNADDDGDDAVPVRSGMPSSQGDPPIRTVGQRAPQVVNPPAPATSQPSEVTQPVVFAPIGTTSAPATATTTPVNPDDASDPATESVRTPQQIFEQLQKLQQGNGSAADPGQQPQ